MSERLILHSTIAGAPMAKGRPRFSRKIGRAYTPDKTVKYETYLRTMLANDMNKAGLEPIEGPVSVRVVFTMPEPKSMAKKLKGLELPHVKKPDLDNMLKAVLDSMNQVVVKDDSQVFKIETEKRYGSPARTELFVFI